MSTEASSHKLFGMKVEIKGDRNEKRKEHPFPPILVEGVGGGSKHRTRRHCFIGWKGMHRRNLSQPVSFSRTKLGKIALIHPSKKVDHGRERGCSEDSCPPRHVTGLRKVGFVVRISIVPSQHFL
ncbi:hypothetical protein CDAR_605671 [Caerostris darwini]|uniref:Uncharacterized protein n=1 Tax=Caerostris darwini TaxID=1538125 RepID=A0AAV4VA08_9ARAC|nr:hypothetical protein CDAR_605671 [Caerostris darwini]